MRKHIMIRALLSFFCRCWPHSSNSFHNLPHYECEVLWDSRLSKLSWCLYDSWLMEHSPRLPLGRVSRYMDVCEPSYQGRSWSSENLPRGTWSCTHISSSHELHTMTSLVSSINLLNRNNFLSGLVPCWSCWSRHGRHRAGRPEPSLPEQRLMNELGLVLQAASNTMSPVHQRLFFVQQLA
jgi:hypothetical protein